MRETRTLSVGTHTLEDAGVSFEDALAESVQEIDEIIVVLSKISVEDKSRRENSRTHGIHFGHAGLSEHAHDNHEVLLEMTSDGQRNVAEGRQDQRLDVAVHVRILVLASNKTKKKYEHRNPRSATDAQIGAVATHLEIAEEQSDDLVAVGQNLVADGAADIADDAHSHRADLIFFPVAQTEGEMRPQVRHVLLEVHFACCQFLVVEGGKKKTHMDTRRERERNDQVSCDEKGRSQSERACDHHRNQCEQYRYHHCDQTTRRRHSNKKNGNENRKEIGKKGTIGERADSHERFLVERGTLGSEYLTAGEYHRTKLSSLRRLQRKKKEIVT
jgi:hypothetical protein